MGSFIEDLIPSMTVAGDTLRTVTIPEHFQLQEVDGFTSPKPQVFLPVIPGGEFLGAPAPPAPPPPTQSQILDKFVGAFKGIGLNMIWRPAAGSNQRDTILEYNTTIEYMTFLKPLDSVPNRGLKQQPDVFLKAVPYTQVVEDAYNSSTGGRDLPTPIGVHFEQGLFIKTPPTDRPKVDKGTIARLASIPHGTTINCQGFEQDGDVPTPGKPDIQPLSIVPFPKGHPEDRDTFADFFPQMRFDKINKQRIPDEVKSGGALTHSLMLNPNEFLIESNQSVPHKRIKDHLFFSVSSDTDVLLPPLKIPGGGTANTSFLNGTGMSGNAKGVSVVCNYWVSTVEYDVLLPTGDWSEHNQELKTVLSQAALDEQATGRPVVSPSFVVHLMRPVPENTMVKFEATQIQYSQLVILEFDQIGWPHVSVGTLLPADPIHIRAPQVVF